MSLNGRKQKVPKGAHGSTIPDRNGNGNGTTELGYLIPYHLQQKNTRNILPMVIRVHTKKKKRKKKKQKREEESKKKKGKEREANMRSRRRPGPEDEVAVRWYGQSCDMSS